MLKHLVTTAVALSLLLPTGASAGAQRTTAPHVAATYVPLDTASLLSLPRSLGYVALQFETRELTLDELLDGAVLPREAWVVRDPGQRIVYLGTLPLTPPVHATGHRVTIASAEEAAPLRAASEFFSATEYEGRLIVQVYLYGVRLLTAQELHSASSEEGARRAANPKAELPRLLLAPRTITVRIQPLRWSFSLTRAATP